MLPVHLIPNSVARFNYIGSTRPNFSTYSSDFLSRSLETNLRLNVGGGIVDRGTDTLSREWLPDDSYITNPQNAKNYTGGTIERTANDTSESLNSNQYIAPDPVYETAKESKNGTNGLNISWSVPVEKNIDHFLRLHFCDIFNLQTGLTIFFLYIYDQPVIKVNDVYNEPLLSTMLHDPYYYDFVVRSDGSGLLKVSVVPNTSADIPKTNAFLNGLELVTVIKSSGPIPLDDLDSRKISLPVAVGSVVGGLVLVSIVAVLFLWISKIRKQKPVKSFDLLPIPTAAGGISHSKLTYGKTTQGSPLPNITLGLKISLHIFKSPRRISMPRGLLERVVLEMFIREFSRME